MVWRAMKMIQLDFSGKTAYITGGAGFIGEGIASAFAEGGANIAIADMNQEWMDQARERITSKYGVTVRTYPLNISIEDDVTRVTDQVFQDFGRMDIFSQVASPGPSKVGDVGPFYNVPMSAAKTLVETNLYGTAYCVRSVLKYMLEQKSGKILLVASISGRYGLEDFSWYGATKAAMIHLTQSIARGHNREGINCNAICPGVVLSPLLRGRFAVLAEQQGRTAQEVEQEFVGGWCPQGEAQTPEDMGYAAAFLCSDQARHINGQTLNVCGAARVN